MVLGGGSGGPLPDGQAHRHQPNMVRHTGTNQITKQHVFRCFTIHVLRIACSESMPKCDLNHIHVLPLFAAFFTVLPLFASASSWGPSQDRHQQRFATAAVPSISATGLGVIARSELGNGGGIRHEPDGLPVQSRRRPSDGSRRRRDQRRRQWRRPSFLDHQRHVHLMFMIDWHGSHCSSTWASQAWGRQGTRPGPSATLSGLRHHRGDRRLSASGVSYNDTSELSFSDWLSPDQPAD